MRFLIAADKFKGSLSSEQVAAAIRLGIERAFETCGLIKTGKAQFDVVQVSDGGEGFLLAIADALDHRNHTFEIRVVETTDPLGRPIEADYLLDSTTNFAYVELAVASGLSLLEAGERDPTRTSTLGTGELIRHAIEHGATRVYVGIGGSATNDAGMGIAHALGYRFLDAQGNGLPPVGESLSKVESIDVSGRMDLVPIFAVNDVTNPLFGPEGASRIYAAQKGADDAMISQLDDGLERFASVVAQSLSWVDRSTSLQEGAGAAGGTGYGLRCFADATFIAGADLIFEQLDLDRRLEEGLYDIIITGEGKLDEQTEYGKLVSRVAKLAYPHEVFVVAFCGISELLPIQIEYMQVGDVVEIHDPAVRSLAESMSEAETLLTEAAHEWMVYQIESANDAETDDSNGETFDEEELDDDDLDAIDQELAELDEDDVC